METEQEWEYTIAGGVSMELYTKRRQSVNCQSRYGYIALEVSDCNQTWVYNSLEALLSHEVSRSYDTWLKGMLMMMLHMGGRNWGVMLWILCN